jgi:hypothetical protein
VLALTIIRVARLRKDLRTNALTWSLVIGAESAPMCGEDHHHPEPNPWGGSLLSALAGLLSQAL